MPPQPSLPPSNPEIIDVDDPSIGPFALIIDLTNDSDSPGDDFTLPPPLRASSRNPQPHTEVPNSVRRTRSYFPSPQTTSSPAEHGRSAPPSAAGARRPAPLIDLPLDPGVASPSVSRARPSYNQRDQHAVVRNNRVIDLTTEHPLAAHTANFLFADDVTIIGDRRTPAPSTYHPSFLHDPSLQGHNTPPIQTGHGVQGDRGDASQQLYNPMFHPWLSILDYSSRFLAIASEPFAVEIPLGQPSGRRLPMTPLMMLQSELQQASSVDPATRWPPPRPGFARNTTEDQVAICPNCRKELAYDPNVTTLAAIAPGKKKAKKQVAEHHFWAVKDCGHVSWLTLHHPPTRFLRLAKAN